MGRNLDEIVKRGLHLLVGSSERMAQKVPYKDKHVVICHTEAYEIVMRSEVISA